MTVFWFQNKQIIDDVPLFLKERGTGTAAGISKPEMDVDAAEYYHAIEQIHEAIRRGDTYQINYTVRLMLQAYGSPVDLYRRLRQKVPYASLAKLPENGWVLCFSPELFLKIDENGLVATEPMKGTAPRLGDDGDDLRAQVLREDPKNRAENTMIVDLLRNDLGKLAHVGGVRVPEPFKVSAFGSVWQMTSLIEAQLPAKTSVAQIFRAAFPCGSITGAPKRKSMELIETLEKAPRGLYTGSIGFLEPKPNSVLGFSGSLNVVIRTLQLFEQESGAPFQGVYGVGSGIVIDSTAESEFVECGWKARFLNDLRPEFALFETMRVSQGQIAWQEMHLARLSHSAAALNMDFDETKAQQLLQQTLSQADSDKLYRLKLSLNAQGKMEATLATLDLLAEATVKIGISKTRLPVRDYLRQHKIDQRMHFDRAWQQAQKQGGFDALFFNEEGILLEGGRSSVMIEKNGQRFVPALKLDVLNSLTRLDALKKGAKEAHITLDQLLSADGVWVGNALRGWLPAVVCENIMID